MHVSGSRATTALSALAQRTATPSGRTFEQRTCMPVAQKKESRRDEQAGAEAEQGVYMMRLTLADLATPMLPSSAAGSGDEERQISC